MHAGDRSCSKKLCFPKPGHEARTPRSRRRALLADLWRSWRIAKVRMETLNTNPPVPITNTYWVLPGQFLAGEYPGDCDEEVARTRISALLDAGIRTFMDLTEECEIAPGYSALLRALADDRRTEITYLRVPIPDRSVLSVWTMRCILDVLDRSLADENPAFAHCFAGIGRTGAVVGCYLKRHRLATDQDVMARIAELRRLMPYGRDPSPQTPEQVRMVRTWKAGA